MQDRQGILVFPLSFPGFFLLALSFAVVFTALMDNSN
jgi:hypothetical protein